MQLNATNLSFYHQQNPILSEITLTLAPHQINVLIGPNGAGKSTLFRLLSGYLSPHSGNVTLNQKPLSDYSLTELAQIRAVMKQHSPLYFPFSVKDVIEMGKGSSGQHSYLQQDFEELLKLTECAPLLHKAYFQLSGGEQQRVQLARALWQLWAQDMQDKILFLDEPISAFDLYHQQHCLRLLHQLNQERKLTVFMILHDLNLSALYADQMFLLAEQRIQACGTPEQVLTQANIQRYYRADIQLTRHPQTQSLQVQFLK